MSKLQLHIYGTEHINNFYKINKLLIINIETDKLLTPYIWLSDHQFAISGYHSGLTKKFTFNLRSHEYNHTELFPNFDYILVHQSNDEKIYKFKIGDTIHSYISNITFLPSLPTYFLCQLKCSYGKNHHKIIIANYFKKIIVKTVDFPGKILQSIVDKDLNLFTLYFSSKDTGKVNLHTNSLCTSLCTNTFFNGTNLHLYKVNLLNFKNEDIFDKAQINIPYAKDKFALLSHAETVISSLKPSYLYVTETGPIIINLINGCNFIFSTIVDLIFIKYPNQNLEFAKPNHYQSIPMKKYNPKNIIKNYVYDSKGNIFGFTSDSLLPTIPIFAHSIDSIKRKWPNIRPINFDCSISEQQICKSNDVQII